MQAKIDVPSGITSLLDSFGIELSAGGLVVMTDFAKAENAYIHHSTVPVAVVAMAMASPVFAGGRFPKLRLVDVVGQGAVDGWPGATCVGEGVRRQHRRPARGLGACASVCGAPARRDAAEHLARGGWGCRAAGRRRAP